MSGRGAVCSAVTFHQLYHPAFASAIPYAVGLVTLDEGPTLYASVAADVRSGDAVRVEFDAVAGGVALPRFVRPQ